MASSDEAVFGEIEAKSAARWLIWEAAQALGIRPASIQDFYLARGRGEIARSFTVPAMNLRMLAYDSARAVFRAARKIEAGAIIFEIARSEIGYTDQRPSEYVSAVLAAAIKERHPRPGLYPGRSLPDLPEKIQPGSSGGAQDNPGLDPRIHRRRFFQHRH